jgi:hypothetical protein
VPTKSTHGVIPVTSPQDLPQPVIERRSRNYRRRACPRCERSCYRDKHFTRRLHDLGDSRGGRPRDIELVYSQHHCVRCKSYFSADTSDLAPAKSDYTHRVMSLAVRLVIEDGMPYQGASWRLWRDHLVFVPFATIQNWVEGAGEKKQGAAG